MAWHKGTWWPLFVKEWYAPKSSQHMFDPYVSPSLQRHVRHPCNIHYGVQSFCLVVLGLGLHLLWGTDDIDLWLYGFGAALAVQLSLEVLGNSPPVLRRIRDNSGTSGEYIGRKTQ